MKRRRSEREKLQPALSALIARVPTGEGSTAPLRYLSTFATQRPVESDVGSHAAVIHGDGLRRLCDELGGGVCGRDLMLVARTVPRSQSTPDCINVSELCFAICQAMEPADVHERRKNFTNTSCIDESIPLVKYYEKDLFAELLGHINPVDIQSEWQKFLNFIFFPLPMSLRVHRSERILQQIANNFLLKDSMLSVVLQPVSLLPSSVGLYSCSHAAYHAEPRIEYICRTLHAAGAVSFQEVVSAIPVVVADIRPHHAVLDMCAAPGSKSLQALDVMLQDGWATCDASRGVMIVNEKDRAKATQVLPARLKRFHAPNVICTRCDATKWPCLFYSFGEAATTFAERRFDRIICDVPCSGDGTIRKEPGLASSWSSEYVELLVPTQKALLRRGLDLLNKDGVLVYSTCSMNPKEDEEVVCAALELFGDTVELLDVNAILRERGAVLHSAGGLLSPCVNTLQSATLPSTFDARKLLRVFPHRDNTGGFFVAAFRKRFFPTSFSPAVSREKLNNWTKGKLWAPVRREDAVWCNIAEFYGFDPDCADLFQYFDTNQETVEREEKVASCGLVPVYHLNPNDSSCRRILLLTAGTAQMLFATHPYKGPGVEVVSAGVRAFEVYYKNFLLGARCRWRAVVESASYLAPHMTARKLILDATQHSTLLKELLSNGFVHLQNYWRAIFQQEFSNAAAKVTSSLVRKDGSLGKIFALTECAAEPAADELHRMFAEDLFIGGVLIGVVDSELLWSKENPWWLSASLSYSKLEISVSAALRAFGLLAFFQVDSGIAELSANLSKD